MALVNDIKWAKAEATRIKGKQIALVRVTPGEYDYDTGGYTTQEDVYPCLGRVRRYKASEIAGIVSIGDFMVRIPKTELPVEPLIGDYIIIDDIRYRVIHPEKRWFGEEVLDYVLTCRTGGGDN